VGIALTQPNEHIKAKPNVERRALRVVLSRPPPALPEPLTSSEATCHTIKARLNTRRYTLFIPLVLVSVQ
jgi:hypothetical protein